MFYFPYNSESMTTHKRLQPVISKYKTRQNHFNNSVHSDKTYLTKQVKNKNNQQCLKTML